LSADFADMEKDAALDAASGVNHFVSISGMIIE